MQKNEAQEQIIHTIDGQMIVVACPGSGKTTTILRRIHHMVEDEKIEANSILMITFTKAAAQEMKSRYAKMYGAGSEVTFCTIHALCLAILRKFGGYSASQIVKQPTDYIYPVIRYNRTIRDKSKFMKDALMDISIVKNSFLDVSEYKPQCCDDPELFQKIYEYYITHMSDDGMIDYDDILLLAYQMLKDEPDILDWVRDKYAYIHVDEYQDTNFLQRDIIYLIAGENGNLTVVGDDDQSIYAFRGARPEVMLNFTDKYPNATTVYMTTNYRSDKAIIQKASSLISNNKHRFPKEIIASSTMDGEIARISSTNRTLEVAAIVQQVKGLLAEKVAPDNIAILYRTNAQASEIADAFDNAKIPYYSRETLENRYNNWMFADIQSYFRLALGIGNEMDFIRTVRHPNRWLSTIRFDETGLDYDKMERAICSPKREKWKNMKSRENIRDYLSLLRRMQIYESNGDIYGALRVLAVSGQYSAYLREYAEYRNQDPKSLLSSWDAYKKDISDGKIKNFTDWERFISAYNIRLSAASKRKSGVCLSTMHGAKGLEWDHVFLIDCVDGINPYKQGKMEGDLEEERRLFYVAMTRAKHNLYLYSYSTNIGKETRPSPYLKEAGILTTQNKKKPAVASKS